MTIWANLKTETQYLKFLYPGIKTGAGFDGVDPHLIWAELSYLAGADMFSDSPIPVLFEVRREVLDQILSESLPIVNLTGGSKNLFGNFYTGFVTPNNFKFLLQQVDRLRIASVDLPSTEKMLPAAGRVREVPLHSKPEETVIGIIDHGIGFANRHFATQNGQGKWHSRIERLWDQQRGYPAEPPHYSNAISPQMLWQGTPYYRYGRELVNAGRENRIDQWLNHGVSEQEIYRALKYLPAQGAVAHGTHVLGLAAGNRNFGCDTHGAPVQTVTDDASRAKIIAVQLPAVPFKDTSGAGLCVQILDAISYIHRHAAGRKVVINLSDGAYAGPHDGTSMLERAIDGFYISNKHRSAFVVAAGNQFHEKVHWQDSIPPDKKPVPITWRVLPDDNTDSHLEIWPDSGVAIDSLKELEVYITPPGLAKLGPVKFGDVFSLFKNQNTIDEPAMAMASFIASPPNSFPDKGTGQNSERAMIHIALAATRPSIQSKRIVAPHGIWTIELVNHGRSAVAFNAYIERDNPALGDTGPTRQSQFVHPDYPRNNTRTAPLDDAANPSPIKRMGALNNVATAVNVFVVGGVTVDLDTIGGKHPELGSYSAAGPGRGAGARTGVDVLAPSDLSRGIRGIRGLGNRAGTSFRMDGTSVAAPQVTRAVANNMQAGFLADKAKASIVVGATNGIAGPSERIGAGLI